MKREEVAVEKLRQIHRRTRDDYDRMQRGEVEYNGVLDLIATNDLPFLIDFLALPTRCQSPPNLPLLPPQSRL